MISPSKVTVLLLQLDLYNQRILEKREQQYKEMLAWKKEKSKDGTLVAPGITTFLYTKLNHRCLNYTHFSSKPSVNLFPLAHFISTLQHMIEVKRKGNHVNFLSLVRSFRAG